MLAARGGAGGAGRRGARGAAARVFRAVRTGPVCRAARRLQIRRSERPSARARRCRASERAQRPSLARSGDPNPPETSGRLRRRPPGRDPVRALRKRERRHPIGPQPGGSGPSARALGGGGLVGEGERRRIGGRKVNRAHPGGGADHVGPQQRERRQRQLVDESVVRDGVHGSIEDGVGSSPAPGRRLDPVAPETARPRRESSTTQAVLPMRPQGQLGGSRFLRRELFCAAAQSDARDRQLQARPPPERQTGTAGR